MLALTRLRQEDCQFVVSLGYMWRPWKVQRKRMKEGRRKGAERRREKERKQEQGGWKVPSSRVLFAFLAVLVKEMESV